MSIHINAKDGDIAEIVLLPGDPLRAKFIAETFLENPVQYNDVRNMFGYTGTYKGHRISVQGTGMGVPSISIFNVSPTFLSLYNTLRKPIESSTFLPSNSTMTSYFSRPALLAAVPLSTLVITTPSVTSVDKFN